MLATITAIFTALGEGFKSLTSCKNRQSETTVLKDRKHLEKAVNYAEKLIFYIENRFDLSTDKKYQRLRKNFFKYN